MYKSTTQRAYYKAVAKAGKAYDEVRAKAWKVYEEVEATTNGFK